MIPTHVSNTVMQSLKFSYSLFVCAYTVKAREIKIKNSLNKKCPDIRLDINGNYINH